MNVYTKYHGNPRNLKYFIKNHKSHPHSDIREKGQQFAKVMKIHPADTMNVCTIFHGSPSYRFFSLDQSSEMMDGPTSPSIEPCHTNILICTRISISFHLYTDFNPQ